MDASLRNFNEQRLATQYNWFGNDEEEAPFILGGTRVQVCATAVRLRAQLIDGGFTLPADFIVRLRVDRHPEKPELEEEVEYKGEKYRVVEVNDHPHSGEWKLTIGDLG